MPSERYEERKPFFDKVFADGVKPFVHPTGLVGVRIVTEVEESNLDPFYSSPYGQRAKNPSDLSIFLANSEETARAEVLHGRAFSGYPPNSWSLQYSYQGNILDISLIQDEQFRRDFLQASGEYKYEFSQDFRHYLTEMGLTDEFDSIGWPSVRSQGEEGFVYNWVSGVMPHFDYLGKTRLDEST